MRKNPDAGKPVSGIEHMTVEVALQEEVALTSPGFDEELLAPKQVAVLFGVDPKTVSRWAKEGKVGCVTTPGGHRRYRSAEVYALLHAPHNSSR